MKKLIAFAAFFLAVVALFSQNIAVNTSGAAGGATNMFEVTQTSTAANMVAIYAIHSGATVGTGYGLYSLKNGASTTNIAGYFEATGGTSNYPGIFMGGNVGIGIATPARKLDIQQSSDAVGSGIGIINTAGSSRLNLWSNGTVGQIDAGGTGANNLLLNAGGGAGKVGIGTTNPLAKLHVEAATAFFRNTSVNSSGVEIYGGTDGTSSSSVYMKNSAGTISTYLSDGTYNSYINATGNNVGIGTSSPMNTLHVNGVVEAAYSNDNMVLLNPQTQNALKSGLAIGYNLTYNGVPMTNAGFLQAETQGAGYRSILLNPIAGNVGIGTTNPSAHLEVIDATSGANSLTVSKNFNGIGNTNAAFIGGTDFAYGNTGIYVNQKDGLGFPSSTSYIFNVVNNAVSAFVVNGLGCVGIGTLTPANADGWTRVLDVNGGGTHAKSIVTTTNIETGVYSHEFGMWGAPVGGIIATRSNHPLSFVTNAAVRATILASGNFGIGSVSPVEKLMVRTGADLNMGITTIGGIVTLLAHNDAWSAWGDLGFQANNLVIKGSGATMGYVGIQTAAPGYPLTVNGQPAANGYTAFTNYSDARLKKNVTNIGSSLDKIMSLRPVQFNYNEEYLNLYNDSSMLDRVQKGFIAQEVKSIFPEMVGSVMVKGREYLDLNLSNLQVYMIKAMQEQQRMIDSLKLSVKSLAGENKTLKVSSEERIEKLESEMKLLQQMLKEEAKK